MRFIFGYVIPGLLVGYAVIIGFFVLWYICSSLDKEVPAWYRAYSKLNVFGWGCLNVVCIYWFFHWKAQSAALSVGSSTAGRSDIDTVVALLIMSVVLYIPLILRCFFIPIWLSGLIFVYIAIYGL
jgi:hypothetical protein